MAQVSFKANQRLPEELGPDVRALTLKCCLFVEGYAKARHPYTDQTGTLTRSISSSVEGFGRDIVGRVVAAAPYAVFVELGTRHMLPRPFLRPALMALPGFLRSGR